MSWLFGFYSKQPNNIPSISNYHPGAISSYLDSDLYVAVGGNDNLITCQTQDNHLKFFVCGLGISADGESFLGINEWENLLLTSQEKISKQNGHYCGVQINDD